MQEHIRRAHPEHYISKLPATEDSFLLMINTPPREREEPQPGTTTNNASNHKAYVPDRNTYFRDDYSNPSSPRPYEDYAGGMIPAASALASLHHYKSGGGGGGGGSDWDAEGVSLFFFHYLAHFQALPPFQTQWKHRRAHIGNNRLTIGP